jgi:glucose/arabinose dehydrogenase
VDVAQLPDGSLIVSDDFAGALYRITYKGDEGAVPSK